MIYFIQVHGDAPAIKIGFTASDPLARLGTLQTATAHRLELIAVIPLVPVQIETELHRRFAHLNLRGEWHRVERELTEFIAEHAIEWRDIRLLKSKDKAIARAQEAVIRDHISACVVRRPHTEAPTKRDRRWAALGELGLAASEIARREGWDEAAVARGMVAGAEKETWQGVLAGRYPKGPKGGETRVCEKCEDDFQTNQKDRFCPECRKSVLAAMKASGYLASPPRTRLPATGCGYGSGEDPSFENAIRAIEG